LRSLEYKIEQKERRKGREKEDPEYKIKQNARHRRRYKENPNYKLKKLAKYRIKENREYRSNYKRKKRVELRLLLLKILGSKCVKCELSDPRVLQIDHVKGKGTEARRSRSYSSRKLLKDIKSFPEKYQLLCANHNWIKRYENFEVRKSKLQ